MHIDEVAPASRSAQSHKNGKEISLRRDKGEEQPPT